VRYSRCHPTLPAAVSAHELTGMHCHCRFVRLDSKDKEPPVVSYKKLVRDAEEAGRQRSAGACASMFRCFLRLP
jgi:hypothetical protein